MKALHTLALTAAAMIVIFGAYGLVDKIDRNATPGMAPVIVSAAVMEVLR